MMTLNIAGKTCGFKEVSKMAYKHSGFNPNDPNYLKKLREYKKKSDARLQHYVDEQYYIHNIAGPFIHDSIFDDDSLKKASFRNYDTSFSKEAEVNYDKAIDITNQYNTGKEFNTLLVGPCGRGKSHLALSILKAVLKTRRPEHSGIFMDVNEMMQKIKSGFDQHKPMKARIERQLANTDLVVLDDLGAENISKFDKEILLEIINSNHRIIFTTNLTPKEIRTKYGDRIYSRMRRGMQGHMILFTDKTDDHRFKGGNN